MWLKALILLALAVCLGLQSHRLDKSRTALVVAAVEDALTYDKPPALVHPSRPTYPDFAREVRAEGRVLLKVLVLEDGKVGAIQILESSHPLLVDNAVEAVVQSVLLAGDSQRGPGGRRPW